MAFTGVGVPTSLGSNVIRISGLSLAAGATGTIGEDGSGANYELPPGFLIIPDYAYCFANYVSAGAPGIVNNPIVINLLASLFTIINQDGVNSTGDLDIVIRNIIH